MAADRGGPRQLRGLPAQDRPRDPGRGALPPVLSARPLTAERTWRSSQAPDEVWPTILDVEAYRSWWPWLTRLDPLPLQPDARTRAVVRAPAGYRLRIDLLVVEVHAPRSITFAVTGDISGRSRVRVDPDGDGSRVALAWTLRPDRPLLRALGLVARPVLVRGHDRILDDGLARCCAATGLDLTEVRPR